MRVRSLRTHIDSQQVTRKKGDVFDVADRDAQDKIRRGLIHPAGEVEGGRENKRMTEAPEQGRPVKRGGKGKAGPITSQQPSPEDDDE